MDGIDWKTAIHYARLVAIAENVEPDQEYAPADIDAIQALGYTFVATIYGNELATDVSPHKGETVTYGFLGVSAGGELLAAIRGTDTILEWVHDGEFLLVRNPVAGGAGLTEDGFTAIYKSLRVARGARSQTVVAAMGDALQPGGRAQTATVAGHSLGGALATLLALDVALHTSCRAPAVYTFASPRTGDPSFAAGFDSVVKASFRVASSPDLVPKLPPILPIPYEHVNSPYELMPPLGAIREEVGCKHHLSTYLWLMGLQAADSNYPLDSECRGVAYLGAAT